LPNQNRAGPSLLRLAVVFASALAVLPLIMAIVAIPPTFLLLLGLTELTTVNFVVQFVIGLVGWAWRSTTRFWSPPAGERRPSTASKRRRSWGRWIPPAARSRSRA
jgi:hypothetical protein